MDDKIIKEFDNINVKQTEEILQNVSMSDIDSEVDKNTVDRIKKRVFEKIAQYEAQTTSHSDVNISQSGNNIDKGMEESISKDKSSTKHSTDISNSKVIPDEILFFSGCLILSLLQFVFLTLSSFIGWVNSFILHPDRNFSSGEILPLVGYFLMLVLFSFAANVLFGSEMSDLKSNKILPDNKTFLLYSLYFIISWSLKLLSILLLVFFSMQLMPPLILFSPLIYSFLDHYSHKVKEEIIISWQADIKSFKVVSKNYKFFLLSVVKNYLLVIMFIALGVLNIIIEPDVPTTFINILVLWGLNIINGLFLLHRRKHLEYISTNPNYENEKEDKSSTNSSKESIKSSGYIRKKLIPVAVMGVFTVYVCGCFIYTLNANTIGKKPVVEGFVSMNDMNTFLVNNQNSKYKNSTHGFSPTFMFLFNKILLNALNLNTETLDIGYRGRSRGTKSTSSQMQSSTNNVRLYTGNTLDNGDNKSKSEYSSTNKQVESVDEADVIKTDGKYVYYINKTKLFILNANPPDKMGIVYQHDFREERMLPQDLFLYNNRIGIIFNYIPQEYNIDTYNSEDYYYSDRHLQKTILKTYNVKDPSNITEERVLELKCHYLSSRMIDNQLYIIGTSTIYDNNQNYMSSLEYTDSASERKKDVMDYQNLYVMGNKDDTVYSDINIVASLSIDNKEEKTQVKGYIGGGGDYIYVSDNYIYIAQYAYGTSPTPEINDFVDCIKSPDTYSSYNYNEVTNIYRIKIENGVIGNADTASVPGRINNQFSMDEHNGYFRLAVQKTRWSLSSSIYVLDKDLKTRGTLNNLAPEENIYATRFIGDRLYLVTFKQIDPLFVIDLKNPDKPKVLGKLKIPGYSTYIHPLDENHIIGFGQNTEEVGENSVKTQGLKMAIFDVTNVHEPKEKHVELIGGRGTESELLTNHKALMFMKNQGIIAFPVLLAKENADYYTDYVFQGAYVYNVSVDKGFSLRGKISHLNSPDDISDDSLIDPRLGQNDSFINRIIFANNSLYTFSGNKIKATDYESMTDVSQVDLK